MTAAAPDATTAPRRVIVFGGGQIGTFALRSLLPSRWHSQRVRGRGTDEVHIDVQLDMLVPDEAEKLARRRWPDRHLHPAQPAGRRS